MILFYSPQCNHCNMLIDNIKRYDKDKKIKLVCINDLISENIEIEKKYILYQHLCYYPQKICCMVKKFLII